MKFCTEYNVCTWGWVEVCGNVERNYADKIRKCEFQREVNSTASVICSLTRSSCMYVTGAYF